LYPFYDDDDDEEEEEEEEEECLIDAPSSYCHGFQILTLLEFRLEDLHNKI
jgi:hypothetical protein